MILWVICVIGIVVDNLDCCRIWDEVRKIGEVLPNFR